jgi:fumarate hydratase class II
MKISNGDFGDEFPVDVFQTGSGTSTNMNMNEVIANLSSNSEIDIHPNDDVNFGQSSNDVIPSSINISTAIYLDKYLLKAAAHLEKTINIKADELRSVAKTGRTHLMDAMPITMAQEMGAWSSQIKDVIAQYEFASEKIQQLAIGGTAVGTGINAHPDLSAKVCDLLNSETGLNFKSAENFFQAISAQDSSLLLSATNRSLAVALTKISNDLRWMNSGPIGGLGEITLPALQPGSSIMPGKVNPVIPESVSMAASQVFGFDATINHAAQSGNFQLNVMLPLIAYNLIESMTLLTNACLALANKAIQDFEVNIDNLNAVLSNNPILATALNSTVGYETGAKIVKKAYKEKRTIIDVASELTDLDEETLREILDPLKLTQNKL